MVNTFTREVLKPFSVTRSHTQAGARSPGSGVGIVFKVSDTGLMHVKELSPGGAASESKQIKIFDQLISINKEGITGKTLDEVCYFCENEWNAVGALNMLHCDRSRKGCWGCMDHVCALACDADLGTGRR